MSDTLGFVGLGAMGSGMAANLLKSTRELWVWNRSSGPEQPLVSRGAKEANSLAQLARKSSIVFVCVSDTPAVEEVLFGDQGIAAGLTEGDLVVDMSTISPSGAVALAGRLAKDGIHMLDAPVSGGTEGAKQGSLSIMIGGAQDQVERARPFLESMGNRITHIGENGHGQMAKMVNQMLVVGNTLAMCEALVFARAGGLDLEKTLSAITGGAAGSWMLENRGPQILADYWEPGFTIDLQQKDLRLALAQAHELGVPALLTATASQLYGILQREGRGSEGNHALIKALERLSGYQARA